MGASDDETIDAFMREAQPTHIVERREALAEVERGLFGRTRIRHPLTFGRFVLLEKLGSGGGGIVHAAYDPELDRKVAIKLMNPRTADTAETRQRLVREAQAIASLSHPNVLAIFDVGTFDEEQARELSELTGAGVYLVMELVDGPDVRAWLRDARRSVREVLAVFMAAAEGIAAAHEKGIIHRDIKPSNILVGAGGRPRVLDFGLARKLGAPSEPSSGQSPSASALESSLTAHGAVMGTPAYMAPEQHEAAETDERTDQYAFCVSLYEALYGERPFKGRNTEALEAAKRSGKLPAPPHGRHVPRWVREVVARGLAVDPRDRYPDMRALVAALRDDPLRKWGRRSAIGGGVVVLAALSVMTWQARAQQAHVCDATEELRGVWDEATRAAVQQTFDASGLPYAGRVWTHVETALDDWTAAWTQARETACRAAMVEGSHSVADMSRAALCLERRLQRVGGTIGVLRDADAAVIERADRIVQGLPDLTPCEVRRADDGGPGAKDLELRARLLDIERRLAQADALQGASRFEEATELGRSALEASRAAEDPHLEARALSLLAEVAQTQGRVSDAERLFRQAVIASERADDEPLTIGISLSLAFGLSVHGARPDDALQLVEQCAARLQKHGDLPVMRARLAYIRGRVLQARGDHDDALESFVESVSLYEGAVGPDDPRTVSGINNIGVAHDRLGRYEEALRYYERTLEARRARYGERHPDTANALGNVGATYGMLGRYADALEPLRRSIDILTEAFGNDHRLVAWYRANLGQILLDLGEYEEALVEAEAALRIRARVLGAEHPRTASAHADLARVLVELDRGPEALDAANASVDALTGWPDRSLLAKAHRIRGLVQHRLGRDRHTVEKDLREAIVLLELTQGRDHVGTTEARLTYARAALDWGDLALAREHAQTALSILETAQVVDARREPARALVARIDEAAGGTDAP